LETAFTDLKAQVGEKKFGKQIKKASKVLASGATAKARTAPKKAAKKKATTPAKKK